MGNLKLTCCTNAPKEHVEIEDHLRKDGKRELQRKKVLLLGAGSSGKSTLVKQMKYLYEFDNDFPAEQLLSYRRIILLHILNILQAVCQHSITWDIKCKEENEKAMTVILAMDPAEEEKINEYLGPAAKQLWKDESIRKVFARRDEYTLYDNADYFMNDLERIFTVEYRPTFADVLRVRVQTTGIIEQEFVYRGLDNKPERYLIVDVGGQRSERSKWTGQFVDVIAVLWVFALSSYDQVLFEESNVNRMQEEFTLFRETSKNPVFEKTNFIVLLNKYDQFQEKIERIPFNFSFDKGDKNDGDSSFDKGNKNDEDFSFEKYQYKGNKTDGGEVIEWIKETLRSIDQHECLYFHVVTATNTEEFNTVFADCHEIILREHFKRAGVF